jgi:RNA polymerase sigma-70 factor (ECF subfamily)
LTAVAGGACSLPVEAGDDDDRALVERARLDGDVDAFAQLYRRYVGRVHAFAWYRTRDREAAEEITSAAFERAWRAMPKFVWRGGGFEPWLFRIAATETGGWYRRQGRHLRLVHRVAAEPVAEHDERPADVDPRLDALVAAMATLRPRYQEVITLRYLSGLGPEEASEVMGCTKATLAVTLHRAMNALRRAMGATS